MHSLALGCAFSAASALVAPPVAGRRGHGPGACRRPCSSAPAGTALADLVGWRAGFAVEGGVAAVLVPVLSRLLPDLPGQPAADRRGLSVVRRPAVAKPLLTTFAIMLANSVLFTYLGAYLTDVTGRGGNGSRSGWRSSAWRGRRKRAGRAARRPGTAARRRRRAGLMALALLSFGLVGAHTAAAYPLIAVWGVAMQIIVPIVTHQAVSAGGGLAAALGPGVANAGIAAGGLLGSAVLSGSGLRALPWSAAAATVAALVLMAVDAVRRTRRTAPPGTSYPPRGAPLPARPPASSPTDPHRRKWTQP
ncbi:MFS transporter [Streptomyces sp. M19]